MRKTLAGTIVTLISTAALANSGHIIQVHHSADWLCSPCLKTPIPLAVPISTLAAL
jgi:hypothetical protein